MTRPLAGLWSPVSTPFFEGALDASRLVRHSRALLADGADGLAILGTTSEANSLTLAERHRVIDAHVEAGIDPGRLLPGTGACSIGDATELTRHAGEIGAAGVLLLPPFYYKEVPDDGLFAFVAAVIDKAGPNVPRIMLYHIPQMAAIGWSVELTGRLIDAFPGIIAGMKDSSGDPENTRRMIDAFPGFAVFPGAEVYLVKALGWGAVGCISASANINARAIKRLFERWREADAAELQEEVKRVRNAAASRVMIPSLKAVLAARYRDPAWLEVRPPLARISETARAELLADPAIVPLIETVPA